MQAYKGSKWAIIKEEWWMPGDACDHGLCERLHTDKRTGKKTCPEVRRVEWLILNIETNNRLGMGEAYELRRDAVKVLDWHLAKEKAFVKLKAVLENNKGLADLVDGK